MRKAKIILLVFLLITAGLLAYAWQILLSSDIVIEWRHDLALMLFLPLLFLFFKKLKLAIAGMSVYFLLGAFSFFSLTPSINTIGLNISGNFIHLGNPLCWLLFITYSGLNLGTLIELYLDYKESRNKA